jgi:hypothetical protein
VQSVPAPHLVGRGGPRALALAIAVAVALAAVAIGIATSGASAPAGPTAAASVPPPAHAAAYNGLIGGLPLQQARCVQWNAGTAAERDRVVGALAYSVGGATPYGRGTTLSRGEALSLFDNACASPIAQHWLLYELYIRAAGFRSYAAR